MHEGSCSSPRWCSDPADLLQDAAECDPNGSNLKSPRITPVAPLSQGRQSDAELVRERSRGNGSWAWAAVWGDAVRVAFVRQQSPCCYETMAALWPRRHRSRIVSASEVRHLLPPHPKLPLVRSVRRGVPSTGSEVCLIAISRLLIFFFPPNSCVII